MKRTQRAILAILLTGAAMLLGLGAAVTAGNCRSSRNNRTMVTPPITASLASAW